MTLELTFHGAAGVVTGSCMELNAGGRRILIDCGLFQGSRSLEALNHETLPFSAQGLDAVLLTHAHLDHSGRLPLLMRERCSAASWCTPPTRQLLAPLLNDAAKLQAADAERRNARPDRAGRPAFEALYDLEDVRQVVANAHALDYGIWAEPVPGVKIRFHDAHHILGAASIEVQAEGQSLLFSGDIGRASASIEGPPLPAARGWDHVVCESTYGNRDRMILDEAERREALAVIVERALARGGNLLIPAFALERTQMLLEDLVALFESGRLETTPVFVDSPLADRVTQAYRRFDAPHYGPSPFDHPSIRFTADVGASKALNRVTGAVILAGSGMCNGGRIRYHLLRNLPRRESTVLFVGYQAQGTLGAVIESGAKAVRISGTDVQVRAMIERIDAYSAHADHAALVRWLTRRAPVAGSVFLDHGEAPALARLAIDAAAVPGLPRPIVPVLGERFRLEAGKPAERIGEPRPRAAELAAPQDWHNLYAAFAASLEERLRALPSDAARRRAIEAAERTIGGNAPAEQAA